MNNGVQLHPMLQAALRRGETSSTGEEAAPTTNAEANTNTTTTVESQSQARSEGQQDDAVTSWLRSVESATTATDHPSGQSQDSVDDNAEDTTESSSKA